MAHQLNNKPKFQDKEGNMKLQVFVNRNRDKVKYLIFKIWRYRFPFRYNGSIDLYTSEIEKLKILLNRMPEIELKQTEKKKKNKEVEE